VTTGITLTVNINPNTGLKKGKADGHKPPESGDHLVNLQHVKPGHRHSPLIQAPHTHGMIGRQLVENIFFSSLNMINMTPGDVL